MENDSQSSPTARPNIKHLIICPNCKSSIPSFRQHIKKNKNYVFLKCPCTNNQIKKYFLTDYINTVLQSSEVLDFSKITKTKCNLSEHSTREYYSNCTECNINLCKDCHDIHETSFPKHMISTVSDKIIDNTKMDELYKLFESAVNNVRVNYKLSKQFLIEKLQIEIRRLEKYVIDIEEAYSSNKELNEELFKSVRLIMDNYAMLNMPLPDYHSWSNVISNTNFNFAKYDIPEKEDLKDLAEGLLKFYKKNYVIKSSISKWEWVKVINDHQGAVRGWLELSSNRWASCSADKTIKIYQMPEYQLLKTYSGHTGEVTSVAEILTKDNNYLISSSEDKLLKIWDWNDFDNDECLNTIPAHDDKISKCIVLSNGDIASCSFDRTIKIWNIKDPLAYNLQATLEEHNKFIRNVMQWKDLRWVSGAGDNSLKFWDVNSENNYKGYRCLETMKNIFTASNNSIIQLNDGRLAVGGSSFVRIINVNNYCVEMEFKCHNLWCISVVELSDCSLLTGSSEESMKGWDLSSEACKFSVESHNAGVNSLIMLKNDIVVSCGFDCSVKVWKNVY